MVRSHLVESAFSRGLVPQFAEHVSTSFERGDISAACVLVSATTDTKWFQRLLVSAAAVCLVARRVRFVNADGEGGSGALFGQAIIYFGAHPKRFARAFAKLGSVLVPLGRKQQLGTAREG